MSQSNSKTTVITLRLATDLLEALRAQANKEEIPMSYIIRKALKMQLNLSPKPATKSTEVTMPDWE
jgi:predicted DNA binding CopG/RHH family protein